MKNIIILSLIFFFLNTNLLSRSVGQTEITTEGGIEVFQNEKYYFLKKNVQIISDTFELNADEVKAYFDKDLYDIVKIDSKGNAQLKSSKELYARGQEIFFSINEETIIILGKQSSVKNKDIKMFSDQSIKINNLNGEFNIKGDNSKLETADTKIFGHQIDGKYEVIDGVNEIINLFVEDQQELNIITDKINMYSKKAIYTKQKNIIELFDNVKVIRDNETVIGDHAIINTLDQSYKVFSKNTNKVKILIDKKDE